MSIKFKSNRNKPVPFKIIFKGRKKKNVYVLTSLPNYQEIKTLQIVGK